jgi:hypothetical protein
MTMELWRGNGECLPGALGTMGNETCGRRWAYGDQAKAIERGATAALAASAADGAHTNVSANWYVKRGPHILATVR